jgi:saccharopine dehydrogenase (NAD+, L-lysine-forming)
VKVQDTTGGKPMADRAHNFVVLGGAGAIGRVVARDLFESHRHNHILIADFNESEALACAQSFRSRRVRGQYADCSRVEDLSQALRGHAVVINCTHHSLNLGVMQAALAASSHYLDLGGLFYWTRRQLKLDKEFQKAGLTAILGMGCAPGISNLMACQAVELMERVDSVKIRVGSRDFAPQPAGFCFPYSARTIIEELTMPPWAWIGGRFKKTQPRASWEYVNFGSPVGSLWTVRTRHSELATLPLAFGGKGLRFCDFKVSFDRTFVREIIRRRRVGWTLRQFSKLPASREHTDDYEIVLVAAVGWELGTKAPIEVTVECHSRARPDWAASAGDIDTACPASIAAQMIATGSIGSRGVFAPENIMPADSLAQQLRRRGILWMSKTQPLHPGRIKKNKNV